MATETKATVVPLLPLTDPRHFVFPDAAGRWERRAWKLNDGSGAIAMIAQAIAPDGDPADARQEISIPDIWAPIKLFETALLQEGHFMHGLARQEWRGLLGMLAVARARAVELTVDCITLPDARRPARPPQGGLHDAANWPHFEVPWQSTVAVLDGKFAEAAAHLLPDGNAALFEGSSWRRLGRIRLAGRIIGFVVPSVVVAPARGYKQATRSVRGLDWLAADGMLQDPSAAVHVNAEDLLAMWKYVSDLRAAIARPAGAGRANEKIRDPMLTQLRQFEEALARKIGAPALRAAQFKEPADRANYQLPGNPFDTALALQHTVDIGPRYTTHLRPREAFAGVFAGAVLVGERVHRLLGRPARELVLWRNLSFEHAQDPARLEEARRDAARHGFLILSADDLFTDDLCQLPADAEIRSHGEARRFVLPLQPVVLLFLSPEEINARLEIRPKESGCTVSLQLSLYDQDGKERRLPIEKDYETMRPVQEPANLSGWPNFVVEGWSYYFLYCALNPGNAVKPVGIFTPDAIRRALQGLRPEQAAALAGALMERLRDAPVQPIQDEPLSYRALFRLGAFPEAVVCEAMLPAVEDLRQPRPRPAGLILFPAVERPTMTGGSMRVAVDFGTTNSCAYASIGDRAPEPITFENRVSSPLGERSADNRVLHASEFLPLSPITMPFLTILEERGRAADKRLPLWTDRIRYVLDAAVSAGEVIRQASSSAGRTAGRPIRKVALNLKWGKEAEDRERVRLFLSQVALQVLAEAAWWGIPADAIEWYFSYPQEAFTLEQGEQYENLCRSAIDLAAGGAGPARRIDASSFEPESRCSARYFADREMAAFVANVVCIDVGGSTTDVLLVQEYNGIWRGSLRFAGRNILIDYLIENPLLLRQVFRNNAAIKERLDDAEKLDKVKQRDLYTQVLEIIVNSPGFQPEFDRLVSTGIADEATGLPGLARIATFSLAAILHYIGMSIRYLSTAENPPPFNANSPHPLTICLCGRGSMIFRSLVSRERQAKAVRMLQEIAGIPSLSPSIEFSRHPKEEVAYGLLVDRESARTDLRLDRARFEAILGEEMVAGGRPRYATMPAPGEILTEAGTWAVHDLPELSRMIAAYERIFGRQVPLSAAEKRTLCVRITEELDAVRKEMLKNPHHLARLGESPYLHIEPVYVVALRHLVRHLVARKEPKP